MRNTSILLILLIMSGTVAAVDGVYEINQACVPVGCFPGDPPGFPVTITESGSYRLTSNLNVPDADTTAIAYMPDTRVTIDLNGFALTGPTVCNYPVSCAPTGQGSGIENASQSSSAISLTVSNGTIAGFGSNAISPRFTGISYISNVIVEHSGSSGIGCFDSRCIVKDSFFRRNGDGAIMSAEIVTNTDISLNMGGTAVEARRVEGCVVRGNAGVGIRSGLAIGNYIRNSGDVGFDGDFALGGGYANNFFSNNNGGDANPQVGSNAVNLGGNGCGSALCP